jgi:hypothetical protein
MIIIETKPYTSVRELLSNRTANQLVQIRKFVQNKPNLRLKSASPRTQSSPGAPGLIKTPTTSASIHYPITATEKMQNKPNFESAPVELNPYFENDYRVLRLRTPRKNKPNFRTTVPSTKKMQNKPNLGSRRAGVLEPTAMFEQPFKSTCLRNNL